MTQVTISDIAQALSALDMEMKRVEKEQLKLASQLYILMRQQTVASQKYSTLQFHFKKLLTAANGKITEEI